MPRRTGDATAGMRTRTAQIQARQRAAIAALTEHRPRAEQLIEGQRAVHDVAADQAEVAFEVERRLDLAADDEVLEPWRELVHGRDHQIGDFLAMIVP